MKISLLIADDQPVVRHGAAALFKGSDIQVLAEAGLATKRSSKR